MPPRQIVWLCRVFNEDRLAVAAQNLCLPVFVPAVEEAVPVVLEFSRTFVELLDRVTNKIVAVDSKQVQCRWIGIETNSPVVENDNAIKRAVEDGLVFALRGIEDVHSLSMFAASQKKEADVEHNCDAESDQDKRKQDGGQRPTIEMRPERSREQCNGCERDENGTGAHPSLRFALREECARRLHGTAALGTVDQWAAAVPGRNKPHRAVTLQYLHHSGRMLCPDVGSVNMR